MLTINDIEIKIEFKFNAENVNDTPQFVSPMKPSQYLENSYEEYFYENYLKDISEKYILELPDKNLYLKQVHETYPECLKNYQEKYYKGCKKSSKFTNDDNDINFYEYCKKKSEESLKNLFKIIL